ncbi:MULTISPECIES: YdcF family protein [Lysobacter]|uniref:YdcF family protein n=1 Tax=Lysobacter TaxID=68 RepID=UPI001F39934B|nr:MULTISPECIES: YdcF family protein [Lysobacter]UJB19765.1 YdcF family protein [Lysobacter capsici]UJQ26509.1 YdcF family protein [Lysobacter gummosus]
MDAVAAALGWLIEPLHLSLLAAGLAVVAWLARWRRSGLSLFLAGVVWSLLWSMPAAADALRDSLQRAYLGQSAEGMPAADAIVVLGGDIGRLDRFDSGDAQSPELADNRVAAAARAWHAQRAPTILLSGGPNGTSRGISEARIMAQALAKLGVPESAMIQDDSSSDTRQNAEHAARIARERGWQRVILVTSAMHMPRALRWFNHQRLPALPLAPAEAPPLLSAATPWQPSMRALRYSARGLREYAGLLVAMVV